MKTSNDLLELTFILTGWLIEAVALTKRLTTTWHMFPTYLETYFGINPVDCSVCSDLPEHVKDTVIPINHDLYLTVNHCLTISLLAAVLTHTLTCILLTCTASILWGGHPGTSWDQRQRAATRGTMRHAHTMRSGKGDKRQKTMAMRRKGKARRQGRQAKYGHQPSPLG